MEHDSNTLPLEGVTVIDFSQYLAGPFCSLTLGELGAEIIKIESPKGDPARQFGPPFVKDESIYFMSVNRNKKSICLNLKNASGLRLAKELCEKADILIENFRPGIMEKFGLSYDSLSPNNSKLIYCSISGYGQNHVNAKKTAVDLIMQGYSGIQDITGHPKGDPMRVGLSISDMLSGIWATKAILVALYKLQKTGCGSYLDIAMTDSMATLFPYQTIGSFYGKEFKRMGNEHPLIVPYETYKAKDRFFNLCVANEKQWKNFCIAINMPELFKEPKFEKNKDRVINRKKLNEILIPLFSIKKTSYWLDLFERFSVPAGPINSVKDSISEDQICTTTHPEIGEFKYANSLNRIFNVRNHRNIPSPLLGEHSWEVLKTKLELSGRYMEMLREEGAVIGPLFGAMQKQQDPHTDVPN